MQTDDRLSASVVVELAAIVSTGECALLPDDADGDLVYGLVFEQALGDRLDELTDEQIACMDSELDTFNTSRQEPPPSIAAQFARLCAEDRWAQTWADTTSGPHVIEVFLSTACNMDRFVAIEAGLSEAAPIPSAQAPLDDSQVDNTTFFGVVDQIRFPDEWVMSFVGGANLEQEVDDFLARDNGIVLSLPIVAAGVAPSPGEIDVLWASVEDVMAQADYTLTETHTCVKDDAAAVKTFGRQDSVTGDATVSFYPNGNWALFVSIVHPVNDDGYIDRSLANWCI